jgi:hypothetical protein
MAGIDPFPRHPASTRAGGLACAAAMFLASAAAGLAPAGEGETRSVPVALPQSRPAKIPTIAQRIVLTDVERTVLDVTRDNTASLQETGLYAMLGVASRAKQQVKLDDLEWDQLDRPAYVNLVHDPKRYRATPMRFRVKISHVWKQSPGVGLAFSPMIPKDLTVWQMDGVWSDAPYEREKPLRLYSLVDPAAYIGQPSTIDRDQTRIYKHAPEVRVAGLFYKIYTDKDRDGALRDYPVVMVWQMSRTMPAWGGGGGDWDFSQLARLAPLVLLVAVMGGAFYLTRRRLAKMRAADRRAGGALASPRQRREPNAGARDAPDADRKDDEPPDQPVDPELTAAVEGYLRDREDEDADRPR